MSNDYISAIKGYLRLGNFPLDDTSIFDSLEEAIEYAATNKTAYPGQVLSVVDEVNKEVRTYVLEFSDKPGENLRLSAVLTGDEQNELINTLKQSLTATKNSVDNVIDNEHGYLNSKLGISIPTNEIKYKDSIVNVDFLNDTLKKSFSKIGLSEQVKSLSFSTTSQKLEFDKGIYIDRIIVEIANPYEDGYTLELLMNSKDNSSSKVIANSDEIVERYYDEDYEGQINNIYEINKTLVADTEIVLNINFNGDSAKNAANTNNGVLRVFYQPSVTDLVVDDISLDNNSSGSSTTVTSEDNNSDDFNNHSSYGTYL